MLSHALYERHQLADSSSVVIEVGRNHRRSYRGERPDCSVYRWNC